MEPNYYAIIPANVRYDKELIPNAKLMYGEITSLSNEKGYCYAENSYFANLYNVSIVTISKWINQLVQKGYIESEIIYKEGTKQIVNRYLRIVKDPIKEKFNTPIKEKFNDNNINNLNNTSNNKEIYKEICDYLNQKTNSNYRSTTASTQRLIKARLNDGFTVEDFKKVIDIKCSKWLNDEKMKVYLRPETLFGTKFESYLNEKVKESSNDGVKKEERLGMWL